MIKCFCDKCGKETQSPNKFKYLVHLEDMISGIVAYVDNDDNPISGRSIEIDLCAKCYNEVMIPAVKTIKGIE